MPASEHLAGLALAINRRECRIGATTLGRLPDDGRFDLAWPPIDIGDGVSLDFGTRRKGCILRLDGRLYRTPFVHKRELGKKLRLPSPVRLLATT
jgi:hypothetical protein